MIHIKDMEDVTDVVLNLKKIKFRAHSRTRLREFPMVWPYPVSKGSAMNLA